MNHLDLNQLYVKYPGTSWAIWSNDFPTDGCVEENPTDLESFIVENQYRLNPEVIFLSLNPSTHLPEGYTNFHSTESKHFDSRIKEFVQDNDLSNLIGGFMTDLISDTVDPDSNNVSATEDDVEYLLDKLDHLDQQKYHVISFMEDGFEAVKLYFEATEEQLPHDIRWFSTETNHFDLDVYRVWFYGNWGVNQEKVPELEQQLKYLNRRLNSTSP